MARSKFAPRRTRPAPSGRRDPAPSPRPGSTVRWLLPLLLAALALAYGHGVSAPFFLDDTQSIVENRSIRQLRPISVPLSPPAQTPVAGRPIVNVSFALNHAADGLHVEGYRLVNIVLHLLSGLVLFGIVRRTVTSRRWSETFGRDATGMAAVTTLIWLVHPLHTEAVIYITQRTELLMGLFYLLTLYTAIRAADSSRSRRWQVACVLCGALGMASKEVMVTAPVMIALYDRTFLFDSVRAAVTTRGRLYAALAATWGVLAALHWSSPRGASAGFQAGVSIWTYLLNQAPVIVEYLRLSVWPNPLVVYYGEPAPVALGDVLPHLVVVGGLVVGTIVMLGTRPALGFLGAWFFLILLPTSSIIPIATEVAAERRLYLPLAAVVVGGVLGIRALLAPGTWRRPPDRAGIARMARTPSWVGPALAVAVIAALGVTTSRRTVDYRSRVALWNTVVAAQPGNWGARTNLGAALTDEGRVDEARRQFRTSLALNPNQVGAHYNLGNELIRIGQVEDGIDHLRQSLDIRAGHELAPQAHHTLGRALESLDELDQAIDHYQRAVAMAPGYAEAHYNLANALARRGDLQPAIGHYRQALEVNPDDARAAHNLGDALLVSGDTDGALVHFRAAVRAEPDLAVAWSRLAQILATHPDPATRDLRHALEAAERATALTRNQDPQVLLQLAELYAAEGRFGEAVGTAETAVEVLGRSPPSRQGAVLTRLALEQIAAYRAYERR